MSSVTHFLVINLFHSCYDGTQKGMNHRNEIFSDFLFQYTSKVKVHYHSMVVPYRFRNPKKKPFLGNDLMDSINYLFVFFPLQLLFVCLLIAQLFDCRRRKWMKIKWKSFSVSHYVPNFHKISNVYFHYLHKCFVKFFFSLWLDIYS